MSKGSVSSTATSLRWRARVTKEAMMDDFSTILYDDDIGSINKKSTIATSWTTLFCSPIYRRKLPTKIMDFIAVATLCTSVLTVAVTRTWLVAITCALLALLSGWTLWQHRFLHARQEWVQQEQSHLRKTLQSLRVQNERLYRTCTTMDGALDRMGVVKAQITKFVNTTNDNTNKPHSSISIDNHDKLSLMVTECRQKRERIQELLHGQVQEHIVKAYLQCDNGTNNTFDLSGVELERLLVQLQSIPGVTWIDHQGPLRDYLASANNVAVVDDEEQTVPPSLASMLLLLRQLQNDAAVSTSRLSTNTSGPGRRTTPADPKVMRIDVQQLITGSSNNKKLSKDPQGSESHRFV